ncbi:uncharacterized protein LOC123548357 [Mercenaria mercenaria]|uniref:uncharacterized protein LOC123548357 n=1 Tax=Mercenaria mercenaria TaxID=6596 RepID=UPI001E1DB3BD|nr:uncharacterized protein LOC123548357 [Mercenaria mercenaria]
MYVKVFFILGIICNVCDAFLFDEPCNRTIKTPEIDFIIGKDCTHGMININPSASGSLSAHITNKSPNTCSNTVCLKSCNTVSSSMFALPQDPFQCCHAFPRPSIDTRDSTDVKNGSLHKTSTFGEEWICTLPHTQPRIVIDLNVHTSHCPLLVEYDIFATC